MTQKHYKAPIASQALTTTYVQSDMRDSIVCSVPLIEKRKVVRECCCVILWLKVIIDTLE